MKALKHQKKVPKKEEVIPESEFDEDGEKRPITYQVTDCVYNVTKFDNYTQSFLMQVSLLSILSVGAPTSTSSSSCQSNAMNLCLWCVQISRNKGLTPKRSKEQRNPRVKHRRKFKKALQKRKGQVHTFTHMSCLVALHTCTCCRFCLFKQSSVGTGVRSLE